MINTIIKICTKLGVPTKIIAPTSSTPGAIYIMKFKVKTLPTVDEVICRRHNTIITNACNWKCADYIVLARRK